MSTTPVPGGSEPPKPAAPPRQTPAESPRIFSPEFAREMRTMAYVRAEIGITIILDGGLLLLAVAVRAILLRALHWLGDPDPEAVDWAVKIVELVLNFGLVGTVIIFTGFDLLKRIRNGYDAWRRQND